MSLSEELDRWLDENFGEVVEVADELAGKMAGMTIGELEDEIAEAQQAKHQQREIEAKIDEMVKLIDAEIRRLEFAKMELRAKYD